MVDVAAVPERFENAVGEAEHQQILHRLFSQVVIDAINLIFVEDAGDGLVQFARACQAAPKRLFQDDARPGLSRLLGLGQSRRAQVLDDDGEKTRRGGKVKKPIAGGSVLLVKMVQRLLEFLVGLGSAEIVGNVVQALGESFHKGVALRRQVQEFLHRLGHFLG